MLATDHLGVTAGRSFGCKVSINSAEEHLKSGYKTQGVLFSAER